VRDSAALGLSALLVADSNNANMAISADKSRSPLSFDIVDSSKESRMDYNKDHSSSVMK